MFKIKVAVLGPSKCGKTCISNFLSNAFENFGGEYRPTQGVRILEFESSYLKVNGKSINAEIELWDCSGDLKLGINPQTTKRELPQKIILVRTTYEIRFKHLWPVFLHKADGCVFVYDSSGVNEAKELELFYDYFLSVPDIEPKNCVIFANNKSKNKRIGRKLSSKFSQIPQLTIDVEDDLKKIQVHFGEFLAHILERMSI